MRLATLLLLPLLVVVAPGARAAFHVMEVEEIIGSIGGDTSAQAVQLRMRSAGQNQVQLSSVYAWDATGTVKTLLLNIATAVTANAAGSRILLTTSGFNILMRSSGASTFTSDFTMAPGISQAAGRLTFEDDFGTIYWSVAWGGAAYTGSTTGESGHTNDADGNFGKFALGLNNPNVFAPGLVFTNGLAQSTTNSADYRFTTGGPPGSVGASVETVIKNNGTSFTIVPEPGNAALLVVGALGLAGFAYTRRRGRRAGQSSPEATKFPPAH